MPNIFEGLKKTSDNDIIEQVALLETINISNISKPMIQKTSRKAIRVINYLGKRIGKNPQIKEPEVKEIWDLIDEKRNELKLCTRLELNYKMLSALKSKSRCDKVIQSDDGISIKVIEESAISFKIPDDLTPAQKADAVYIRFTERMLENVQKTLKKQDDKTANRTTKSIDKSLEGMTDEQKQQLRNALNVEKLTGETIRKSLLKAGKPGAIIATLSISGFGASVALTTIMHAIFTTVLSVTLPFAAYTTATSALAILTGPVGVILVFGIASYQILNGGRKLDRDLLAQVVWFARESYGKCFTPSEDMLPSFVPAEDKERMKIDEEKYFALIKEHEKIVKQNKESNNILSQLAQKVKEQELIFEGELRKRTTSENALINLVKSKESLEIEKNSLINKLQNLNNQLIDKENKDIILQQVKKQLVDKNNELLKISKLVEDNEEIIGEASNEIDNYQKSIEDLNKKNDTYRKENNHLKRELEEKKEIVIKKEEYKRKGILKRWSSYFKNFIIDSKAIRDVVKFNNDELICIERGLMELYSSKDPRELSRRKMKGKEKYDHMGITFPDGFPTRIYYEVLNDSNKNVRIVEILKHNVKKTQ